MTADRYVELIERGRRLRDELASVMSEIRAMHKADGLHVENGYRIALRPDVDGEDPLSYDTLQDDIVVNEVPMFRAEQMDQDIWWVCCYLDGATGDRIAWNVTAKSRPLRIEWTLSELPGPDHVYEHVLPAAGSEEI